MLYRFGAENWRWRELPMMARAKPFVKNEVSNFGFEIISAAGKAIVRVADRTISE